MPQSFASLHCHVIFSTKHREPWITPDLAERLYPYIGGIVRAEKGQLYAIGGVEDHVHLYLRWRTDGARCVWCVAADPDDYGRRLFIPRRFNFCEEPPALEFRLSGGQVAWNAASRIDPHDPLVPGFVLR